MCSKFSWVDNSIQYMLKFAHFIVGVGGGVCNVISDIRKVRSNGQYSLIKTSE
jgi:hypothetical protein